MSDGLATVEYAVPAVRDWRRPVRLAAAWSLGMANVGLAVLACTMTYFLEQADRTTYGGCGTGRMGFEGLFFAGTVPASAMIITRFVRVLNNDPQCVAFTRLGMFAAIAGHAVLWLYQLGFLHLIKFGSPFA